MIVTPNKNKTAGFLSVSLTDFLESGKQKSPAEVLPLEKCPDKKARFYFAFQMVRVKELNEDELAQELAVDPNLSVLGNTVDFSMMNSLNMTAADLDKDIKMTKK